MEVEMASNQGGKSASSRSSLRRIWTRMQHLFRSLRHSGTPVIDGIEFFLITDRHAASYVFKNMLAINSNGHVTMGSMINEMINDTLVFNPQLSALEVASDLQPDQGGTPSWSFDAPEVGLRAFLHATAADPAIRRRFL
jgi:hypothetical protein